MKLLFLLSFVIDMLVITPSHAQSGPTLPPDYSIEGLTQSEWSQAWWQWAGSFDHDESPIADQTGELCGNKQTGLVWFLAGPPKRDGVCNPVPNIFAMSELNIDI